MDIRQLKYFIAVAEERHVGRAAKRLHISQPPLTRRIHALEEELGAQLFIRMKWGVALTEAGAYLLEQARDIESHVERVKEYAKRAGQGRVGRMDVGVFGSAMLGAIPEILNRFTAKNPAIEVVLHTLDKERQIEALHRGQILLAFERYFPESKGLCVERVYSEPLCVALNARNPLARLPHIELERLRGEPMIGEARPGIAIRALFDKHRFDPLIVQKSQDMISMAVMVAGGFGTAIVSGSLRNLQLPNLVYRPLLSGGAESSIELQCAYRDGEPSPLLLTLLETVHELFFPGCV
jgi:DNA-binding transcriptional LysR family regulator